MKEKEPPKIKYLRIEVVVDRKPKTKKDHDALDRKIVNVISHFGMLDICWGYFEEKELYEIHGMTYEKPQMIKPGRIQEKNTSG